MKKKAHFLRFSEARNCGQLAAFSRYSVDKIRWMNYLKFGRWTIVSIPLPLRGKEYSTNEYHIVTRCITCRLCPYGARNIVVWLVTDLLPLRGKGIQQMNSISCMWCITHRLCRYAARNIVVWLVTDPLPLRGKEHRHKWIAHGIRDALPYLPCPIGAKGR